MEKASFLIVNKKYYLINCYSQTVDGLWISVPPYIKLPLDVSEGTLTENIISALNSSKKNIPHPKDWDARKKEFLKQINEKSLSTIYKNSKKIFISRDKQEIAFMPTKNIGGKGRFDDLSEFEVKISSLQSNHEIYNSLAVAMSNCS